MWCYYSIDERNEFHKISKKSKNQKIRNQKKKDQQETWLKCEEDHLEYLYNYH